MTTKSHRRKNRGKKKPRSEPSSARQGKSDTKNATTTATATGTLVFQDVMNEYQDDPASAFFELANAAVVHYRLDSPIYKGATRQNDEMLHQSYKESYPKNTTTTGNNKRKRNDTSNHSNCKETEVSTTTTDEESVLSIHQNSQAQTHTGGVVWETSYLLLEYLLHHHQSSTTMSSVVVGPNVVELGAGCGLLGLALAASSLPLDRVVLTETQEVLETILAPNVATNRNKLNRGRQHGPTLSCCSLDWTRFREDAEKQENQASLGSQQKFDTILGTDVVFSPALVEPLLQTMRFLSHESSTSFLCLQPDRCPTSYQLLLEKAPEYGWTWDMIDLGVDSNKQDASSTITTTEQVRELSFSQWGMALDCRLIKMRRTPNNSNSS